MPVLITTAAIMALLDRTGFGASRGSFLDPGSIETRLRDLPESEPRDRALTRVRAFATRADGYESATAAALEEYAELAIDHATTADVLIAQRAESDREFEQILEDVLRLRQELLEALSSEEWNAVFG